MSLIVDKRFLPKNATSASREKFIERYKRAIKQKVRDIVGQGSIKNFAKGDKKIKIRADDLDTPNFQLDPSTGNSDRIYIGNKHFQQGDKIKRPSGSKRGGGSGQGGEGEDDFEFILTEKEFSDLFFEDLALPDMIKKGFLGSCFEIKHAGFSRYGGPSSLNIKKTMLNSIGRRLAMKRKEDKELLAQLLEAADTVKKKKIQYIEDMDLKYNFKDRVDVPVTRAVMVCLMDVSGSMGEKEKDLAKRFYILLNMFLKRNYELVDIVFIRHTETAQEVDEDTFFHNRVNGGTIISSGYEKTVEILKARYNPEQWNIYVAQASDGDNWPEDMEFMEKVLVNSLLPIVQYFAYIDIGSLSSMFGRYPGGSEVLKTMKRLMSSHKNLQARSVDDYSDIFPVFRSLFKKEGGK